MMPQSSIAPGFSDPVHQSQAAFRILLKSMSMPGKVQHLDSGSCLNQTGTEQIGAGLMGSAMAQTILTLADADVRVWVSREDAQLNQWIRFHTGAGIAASEDAADFLIILKDDKLPLFDQLRAGSAEAPDRSATLICEVEGLNPAVSGRNGRDLDGTGHKQAFEVTGPGIETVHRFEVEGLAPELAVHMQENACKFPRGNELILTCGSSLLSLTRTTHIRSL